MVLWCTHVLVCVFFLSKWTNVCGFLLLFKAYKILRFCSLTWAINIAINWIITSTQFCVFSSSHKNRKKQYSQSIVRILKVIIFRSQKKLWTLQLLETCKQFPSYSTYYTIQLYIHVRIMYMYYVYVCMCMYVCVRTFAVSRCYVIVVSILAFTRIWPLSVVAMFIWIFTADSRVLTFVDICSGLGVYAIKYRQSSPPPLPLSSVLKQ